MEIESIHREQALEEKVQNRINAQNERFSHEDDIRRVKNAQEAEIVRKETEQRINERIRDEQAKMEHDFKEQRNRLEQQTAQERAHDKKVVEMAKRDR